MTHVEDVPEDGSLARCLGYQIDECPWGQDTDERTIWIRDFLSIGMFLKREGKIIAEWAAWDSRVDQQSTAKLVKDPPSGPLDLGNDHISPVAFLMGGPPWGKNPQGDTK